MVACHKSGSDVEGDWPDFLSELSEDKMYSQNLSVLS